VPEFLAAVGDNLFLKHQTALFLPKSGQTVDKWKGKWLKQAIFKFGPEC